jgi:nicotinic acid mononucleotide adenylyltransferase
MTYLFGLAADPLTKGHIDIIKNVIKRIDAEDLLLKTRRLLTFA